MSSQRLPYLRLSGLAELLVNAAQKYECCVDGPFQKPSLYWRSPPFEDTKISTEISEAEVQMNIDYLK